MKYNVNEVMEGMAEEIEAIDYVIEPLIKSYFSSKEAQQYIHLLNEYTEKIFEKIKGNFFDKQQLARTYAVDLSIKDMRISREREIEFFRLLQRRVDNFVSTHNKLSLKK